MPAGREVIDTIREAFELFSEMELPLKEREVTIMYGAALPLIGYIERLETAQPKWISVEERLPEQEGMYIVYIERNKGNAFIGTDHYDFLNHWGGEGWYDGRYVTHWMPFDSLPEPPKEGV